MCNQNKVINTVCSVNMGLLADCTKYFGSDDLYSVLSVRKEASQSEVKRAYHKLSLKVHPDRVAEDEKEEATIKFQTLGKVYSILSDQNKRAVYDDSGEIDDENDIPVDRDWMEYWRLLYAKISVQDIEEFENKYKGSEEEVDDLKSAYMDFEGDIDQMLESVLCCSWEDVPRFKKILDPLIERGDLPVFDAYANEKPSKQKQRKRKAQAEAAEAEEMKADVGLGDTDDALKQLIQSRQASREKEMDGFFDQLEAKYAKPASGGNKKKTGKKGK